MGSPYHPPALSGCLQRAPVPATDGDLGGAGVLVGIAAGGGTAGGRPRATTGDTGPGVATTGRGVGTGPSERDAAGTRGAGDGMVTPALSVSSSSGSSSSSSSSSGTVPLPPDSLAATRSSGPTDALSSTSLPPPSEPEASSGVGLSAPLFTLAWWPSPAARALSSSLRASAPWALSSRPLSAPPRAADEAAPVVFRARRPIAAIATAAAPSAPVSLPSPSFDSTSPGSSGGARLRRQLAPAALAARSRGAGPSPRGLSADRPRLGPPPRRFVTAAAGTMTSGRLPAIGWRIAAAGAGDGAPRGLPRAGGGAGPVGEAGTGRRAGREDIDRACGEDAVDEVEAAAARGCRERGTMGDPGVAASTPCGDWGGSGGGSSGGGRGLRRGEGDPEGDEVAVFQTASDERSRMAAAVDVPSWLPPLLVSVGPASGEEGPFAKRLSPRRCPGRGGGDEARGVERGPTGEKATAARAAAAVTAATEDAVAVVGEGAVGFVRTGVRMSAGDAGEEGVAAAVRTDSRRCDCEVAVLAVARRRAAG